ncbi:MAG: hypothetical protein HN956_11405, partial [Rhodospirillaceae bacterium]|nr:hypothetical protein [Rhodospirillaceae bacterium]
LFFLRGSRVTRQACINHIDAALGATGWQRQGFTRSDDGLSIQYGDSEFSINFGRMPFLIALYEFLCGMEDYAFYGELTGIFETMVAEAGTTKGIQQAANAIARRLRRYRGAYLSFAPQNERFEAIYGFLRERNPKLPQAIMDDDILDFWRHHSGGDDFRLYRTVFNAFVKFIQALDVAATGSAAESAGPIGTDRAGGEVDPPDGSVDEPQDNGAYDTYGDWRTPFSVLDEPPAAGIKFFKQKGERAPIELLMEYGPQAIALPRAFLRLDSFGPTQSAITTDLQVKRGAASVRRRISCADCETYPAKQAGFENALVHVQNLQKATLHALNNGGAESNVVALHPSGLDIDASAMGQIADDAARAFRALTRKGFNDAASKDGALKDESYMDGFRVGAGAILSIAAQLEGFLAALSRLDAMEPGLAGQHADDQAVFRAQFTRIYGDAL